MSGKELEEFISTTKDRLSSNAYYFEMSDALDDLRDAISYIEDLKQALTECQQREESLENTLQHER